MRCTTETLENHIIDSIPYDNYTGQTLKGHMDHLVKDKLFVCGWRPAQLHQRAFNLRPVRPMSNYEGWNIIYDQSLVRKHFVCCNIVCIQFSWPVLNKILSRGSRALPPPRYLLPEILYSNQPQPSLTPPHKIKNVRLAPAHI